MHDGGKDVGCLRLLLVAFLLKELFLKLGSNSDIHVQNNFGIIHKLLNSAIEVIKQKLAVSDVISNLLEDHRINQEKSDVTCQPLTSYQDGSCQRVRKDQDLVYKNDDNTSVIKKMSKILSEEANLVIHVTSHKNSYEVYQQNSYHGLLSNMDSEKNFEQKFCSCNVNVEGSTENIEIKDWLRKRKHAVQSIYQLKYGNAVSERIIHQVSVSSIILDIHSQNPANKLKIADCNESHQSSRTSVFILYNYARICKILQTFQEQVDKGIYPALPAIVEVDFTLLKQQFEWDILLRHISMYPVLLETCFDLVCNIDETGIPGNKIYRFLEKLSFDLSSYYHHTKILLEPRSHLFNLIHARIAFITAIKSVMLDCFLLLGVDPPLVM